MRWARGWSGGQFTKKMSRAAQQEENQVKKDEKNYDDYDIFR